MSGGFVAPGPKTKPEVVSVHSAGILEALRHVYGVTPLADELVNGHH